MKDQHHQLTLGIDGLDRILGGGIPRDEVYLVQGRPGTGKTTLALQFVREGVQRGARVLYLTLSQTREALVRTAASHGWALEDVPIEEIGTLASRVSSTERQTVFYTDEVEMMEMVRAIHEAIARHEPDRVVIDAMSSLRVLAGDAARYRNYLLEIRQALLEHRCTVLMLDDEPGDPELQGQAHGVLVLEQEAPVYGNVRRRLQVTKMRGRPFLTGYHNFMIRTGGLDVFPRIELEEVQGYAEWGLMPSGVPELDAMLGDGLLAGTACLVVGATGTGKTTLALQYAFAAARRGEPAALFIFDERLETFYRRAASLNLDVRPLVEEGLIILKQVSTGMLTPSAFAQIVRRSVDDDGARLVVIDSLTGYINAMLERTLLITQMHELLTYLGQRGVLSLLVVAEHGFLPSGEVGSLEVSYMADTVLLLRRFELDGRIGQGLAILKKRHGPHEHGFRELHFSSDGVTLGEPLPAGGEGEDGAGPFTQPHRLRS